MIKKTGTGLKGIAKGLVRKPVSVAKKATNYGVTRPATSGARMGTSMRRGTASKTVGGAIARGARKKF